MYLEDNAFAQSLSGKIDSLVWEYQGIKLSKPIEWILRAGSERPVVVNKLNPAQKAEITLSFSMVEASGQQWIKATLPNKELDTAQTILLKSVWYANLTWLQGNKPIRQRNLEVMIYGPKEAGGLGIEYDRLALTAKGFSDVLVKTIGHLLDSTKTDEGLSITAPNAYVVDDFLLGKWKEAKRYPLMSNQGIFYWYPSEEKQLIRWDQSGFRDILLSGKNKTPLPADLGKNLALMAKTRESSFVFLQQSMRDIVNNKNIDLEILAEVLPNVGIGYLRHHKHAILDGKDSLGNFTVDILVVDSSRHVWPNKSSNGWDLSSVAQLGPDLDPMRLTIDIQVKGVYRGEDFGIRIMGNHSLREFIWRGKTVAMAIGQDKPKKLWVLDPTVETSTLNFFLLLAFNTYFAR
ncbi:MAG: hypothetical protein EAZ62_04065 [Sphingobacteriia bacterium]|nr:MAG: hypothetical protein EAZ62_04065 [Sphingobacteriia bacterium]